MSSAKKAITARVMPDILEALQKEADDKNKNRSEHIADVLTQHVLKKQQHTDEPQQTAIPCPHMPLISSRPTVSYGKNLSCPAYILTEPPYVKYFAWVDVSVCLACDKKTRGGDCLSWQMFQQSGFAEDYTKKHPKEFIENRR